MQPGFHPRTPMGDQLPGRFAGKCIGGPYAGQEIVGQSETLVVYWLEGALTREGRYEFLFGQWRWAGPSYRVSVGQKEGINADLLELARLRAALEFIASVQEPFLGSTAYLMWHKAREV